MSKSRVRYLGDLQRLTIEPGDTFVLTMPGPLSTDTIERLRKSWTEQVGDEHKLLVLSDGMRLGVIGKRVEDAA